MGHPTQKQKPVRLYVYCLIYSTLSTLEKASKLIQASEQAKIIQSWQNAAKSILISPTKDTQTAWGLEKVQAKRTHDQAVRSVKKLIEHESPCTLDINAF